MSAKVSVLVPTLNSSEFIEECLGSVIGQTLQELEILCIDAGSTDGTIEKIKEYEVIDSRVRLILSDQKSYGYQLNLGISQAEGEYIGIVESDDSIEKDMFFCLYKIACKYKADYVKADYYETFKDNENVVRRRKSSVLADAGDYGHILASYDKPELLLPNVVAVWSGIYRRAFLINNNICFNETPGASFQDTGFWVQTHVLANVCLFINKAFYRYRIDNPESSTFQINKVFCICDEFDFIQKKIAKERLKPFAEKLSWIFYRKYKRNLERIPIQERADFYQKMARDLRLWNDGYNVKGKNYYEEEYRDLEMLIEDPKTYIADRMEEKGRFISALNESGDVVIYGAGRVGRLLAEQIEIEKVICFIITRIIDEKSVKIGGVDIPLREPADILELKDTATVVVASKIPEIREEMSNEAREMGFRKVICVPFGAFDE